MKVRMGFVSNSSSSSFTAIVAEERFDKIEFSAPEKAVLDLISASEQKFEGQKVLQFSTMSGNYDDLEWISVEEFAKKTIEYAKQLNDPMLTEYENEFAEAKRSVEEKAANRVKNRNYGYRSSSYEWEYFNEVFNEARYSMEKKFDEQKELGFCVIVRLEF